MFETAIKANKTDWKRSGLIGLISVGAIGVLIAVVLLFANH